MPAPYSLDLRRRVMEAYQNKEGSIAELAKRFKVSSFFVMTLIRRFETENTIEPKQHRSGNQSPIQEQHRPFIFTLLEEKNDMTLSEIAKRFKERFGKSVSASAVCRAFKRLRVTRKKFSTAPEKTENFSA